MFAAIFRSFRLKKLKKKRQREKNKRYFLLMQMHDGMQQEMEREGGIAAPKILDKIKPSRSGKARSRTKPGRAQEAKQEVWSAKVQEFRNLNTGRKRAAQDKWNRFAGTAAAGGRGL